jgi:hypothetical protein
MFNLKTESLVLNYSDLLVFGISVIFVGGAVFAYNYFTHSSNTPQSGGCSEVVDSATQSTVETVNSATQTIVTAFNPDNIVQNTDYFKTALISDINVAKASDALRAPLEKVNLTNEIGIETDVLSSPSPAIETTLSNSSLAIPIPDPTALPIPANTVMGLNDSALEELDRILNVSDSASNILDKASDDLISEIQSGIHTYEYKGITFVCPSELGADDLSFMIDFINN